MVELKRIADPVLLQIIIDALQQQGIACLVDNAGMHALMPLPVVMDARLLVDETRVAEARQILRDLGLNNEPLESDE